MTLGAEVGTRATALVMNSEGTERFYQDRTVVHALAAGVHAALRF